MSLEKPVFCKVKDIRPGVHCYNVYCKVLKATHSTITRLSGDILKIVEGVVADSTGSANFKFEGDHTANVKEGATIAIRNGRSEVVDEHIRLETDRFGKISVEDAKSVSSPLETKYSISTEAYQKKERTRDDDDRGRRRRSNRREGGRRRD